MILQTALLRAYRSFNFDYPKKHRTQEADFSGRKAPWETEDTYNNWRPWIQVPIIAPITTIVGLNECGKTHLIDAIYKLTTQETPSVDDICRYSNEGRIEKAANAQFGVVWTELTPAIIEYLRDNYAALAGIDTSEEAPATAYVPTKTDHLAVVRTDPPSWRLLVYNTQGNAPRLNLELTDDQYRKIRERLPRTIRVDPHVSLPKIVSMKSLLFLASKGESSEAMKDFFNTYPRYFANDNELRKTSPSNADVLVYQLLQHSVDLTFPKLVRWITSSASVLRDYSEQATDRIEALLGLSHWWGQDIDVKVSLELHPDELIFHITDRTLSWYGFDERSRGMSYFLAYLLQIILELRADTRPLLILSDEPDFALSAVGQRDLLRFFKRIVTASREGGQCQVLFTTHSAELVDPNHPERISVLRKGLFDEGTTVIRKAHHRLFEPVRSALGARGALLPFIDGPNLLVEGTSDRVFIMRMSQYLARTGQPHIDLSYVTIIAAEGCKRIPRLVASARSVVGDRVYLTVLLDNDEQGRKAEAQAEAMDDYLRKHNQVIMMDRFFEPGLGRDVEIEDLIPPQIYLRAFLDIARETWPEDEWYKAVVVKQLVEKAETKPIVDVVRELLKANDKEDSYDKIEVIERVFDIVEQRKVEVKDRTALAERLSAVTDVLRDRVNDNLRHKRHDEVRRTILCVLREFKRDHAVESTKADGLRLMEKIRELGNRISVPGRFDQLVDAIIASFKLRTGLKSDLIGDCLAFLQAGQDLHKQLAIDPEMTFL